MAEGRNKVDKTDLCEVQWTLKLSNNKVCGMDDLNR
jgi:hypothetical protein